MLHDQHYDKYLGLDELFEDHQDFLPKGYSSSGDYLVGTQREGAKLTEMPSQCGMMVVHGISKLTPEFANEVEKLAQNLKYSAIQVTLTSYQSKERDILDKCGYKAVFEWQNRRTLRDNVVLIKHLQ